MTTYYPSIYKNSHVYSKLNSNSIVITTQSGFDDIVAENNTLLICDENGNWRTDNLINYAKSTDISVLQQKDQELEGNISTNAQNIDNLQQNLNDNYLTNTEVDTKFIDNDELSTSLAKYVLSSVYNTAITNLTTSATTNLNSINTLSNNLKNNYYTKTNINSSLAKYVLSSVYNTAITNLTTSATTNLNSINDLTSNLTNNYYTKSNIDSSLSKYVQSSVYNTAITNLTTSATTNLNSINELTSNLTNNYYTKTNINTSLAKYVQSNVYNTAITNLTTSTTTNLNSINDLTSNLSNNYYTKTNIDSSLAKYVQSSVYNTAITNLTTSTSANLSKISAIQSKQTYILNNIYSNLDTIVNNLSASLSITSGNYVVEGSVYIYINDITLMTPKDEFISDVNWLNSLPILKIFVGDIVVSEILLETNRPLLVLPISDYISLSADKTNIKFTITIPNSANINITIDNILMYKYKITFKEVI